MQVFRQILMQVCQHFDGRDVTLLPSSLLVVGSILVLSHLHLTVHLDCARFSGAALAACSWSVRLSDAGALG